MRRSLLYHAAMAVLASVIVLLDHLSFVAGAAIRGLFDVLRPEPINFRLDPTPRSIFQARRLGLA